MLENNQKKELVLLKDLGMRFPKETSVKKYRYGLYKCHCGNEFEGLTNNIIRFKTKSCGCSKTTHKLTKHRLYGTWVKMIDRCNNKNFKYYSYYGGRGITVCDEWNNIENFINDMYPSYEQGLTLDRIDTNGNYEKNNCRWADKKTQSRNTRKIYSSNKSGYRGVSFIKTSKKWYSSVAVNRKNISLGYFDTAIDAAKAYDKYIIDNNLEHTRNF